MVSLSVPWWYRGLIEEPQQSYSIFATSTDLASGCRSHNKVEEMLILRREYLVLWTCYDSDPGSIGGGNRSRMQTREPTTQTELRSFLGPWNAFRRFLPNFSREAATLKRRLKRVSPPLLSLVSRSNKCSRNPESTTEKSANTSTATCSWPIYSRHRCVWLSSRIRTVTKRGIRHQTANWILVKGAHQRGAEACSYQKECLLYDGQCCYCDETGYQAVLSYKLTTRSENDCWHQAIPPTSYQGGSCVYSNWILR